MSTVSKLDYLMKALNLSGKDVAEYLDMDVTTVSKWRNNQRKIPTKNGIARQLATFLITQEKKLGLDKIKNILQTLKADLHPEGIEQQIDTLTRWLTEEKLEPPEDFINTSIQQYTPRNGYNTNVSMFIGEDGIDEAMAEYFGRVLKMAPGKTIYLIDYSGINWTIGDETSDPQIRINACMEIFRAISNYGHKLVIIDCDTDIYRPYRAIFRWMELYLLDSTEVWSCQSMPDDSYRYTTFVVENELALQCISSPNPSSIPSFTTHGMLYTNKETIDFYADNVAYIMKNSKRLVESIAARDILAMIDVTMRNIKPNRLIYMLNPSLTLQIIDTALLRDILQVNHVPDDKIEVCVAASSQLRHVSDTSEYHVIYNLDILEKFVTEATMRDDNLSELCGTEIILSKDYLRRIIDSVTESPLYKNNQILFTSFVYFNTIPEDLSLLVQEDGFLAVWNVRKYRKRLYCQSLDVISSFYRYVNELTSAIPKISKERAWRDKQLKRIHDAL
ncbi:MAG: helix-turn-helix transcriptional regulator [Clostridiales Family XIII bacterium]|jgi:transcriptional regulator with XRE-family HTH domain|nr:helix-turn-helix transcriptional regulator [Clostridiales Family XIII bacterium]